MLLSTNDIQVRPGLSDGWNLCDFSFGHIEFVSSLEYKCILFVICCEVKKH